jgi:hypothetical protein
MTKPDDELPPDLAEGLRVLARDEPPPVELEDRLVAALRAQGWLGATRRPAGQRPFTGHGSATRAVAFTAVAAAVAFALGVALGPQFRTVPGAHPDQRPRYALFLYQAPASLTEPAGRTARVAEYRAWARSLAGQGLLVGADKLGRHGFLLSGTGTSERLVESPEGVVSGFFLIRADSLDEALALARTCPHIRHGGRIALRPVDPT